ncbi:scavenger receptor cysteine-rich type 1 protein M130-like [Mytilus trossulus]|uniref:scavenger receptor cysteine-rich type 1 protein M130-like n=1 Tax=Mytilus trossulus TaxID=6551 RepID=UPI003004F548
MATELDGPAVGCDLRLVSRRLEIFHNLTWGTVCDDNFDDADAHVACTQLGFNDGISLDSRVPAGNGTIWLDEMECAGNERRLAHCSRNKWGVNNCEHSEDEQARQPACTVILASGLEVLFADLIIPVLRACLRRNHHLWNCSILNESSILLLYCLKFVDVHSDLRLNDGVIYMFYNGTLGTVCDDNFDDLDAQVACRQRGYNTGKFIGAIGNGTGKIWLDNLGCSGNELKLGDCSSSSGDSVNCEHNDDVGIECFNSNEDSQ